MSEKSLKVEFNYTVTKYANQNDTVMFVPAGAMAEKLPNTYINAGCPEAWLEEWVFQNIADDIANILDRFNVAHDGTVEFKNTADGSVHTYRIPPRLPN